jgi:hypothetical protein
MNAQERSETPTIKRDGRFYAGMAALVLMGLEVLYALYQLVTFL